MFYNDGFVGMRIKRQEILIGMHRHIVYHRYLPYPVQILWLRGNKKKKRLPPHHLHRRGAGQPGLQGRQGAGQARGTSSTSRRLHPPCGEIYIAILVPVRYHLPYTVPTHLGWGFGKLSPGSESGSRIRIWLCTIFFKV